MGQPAVPFWDRVAKTEDCWLWTGSVRAGYGRAIVDRRSVRAHRRAWELTNGPIPDGMVILHGCDNRLCVRPDHLSVGTQADNIRDRDRKGHTARGDRHSSRTRRECRPRGSAHGNARLTEEAVRDIRARVARGEKMRDVGKVHGVSASTVMKIAHRTAWGHVA